MRHFARKRFGQHFLVDPFVIGAIVDAIAPRPGDALVEIGPGLGAMTLPLAARCATLTVIELDRDLAARLEADGEAEATTALYEAERSLLIAGRTLERARRSLGG